MPQTDFFLMDNGCGYFTRLWRRQITLFGRKAWVWRDAAQGKGQLEFEDEDGTPVDWFGLPLNGEFVEASTNNC